MIAKKEAGPRFPHGSIPVSAGFRVVNPLVPTEAQPDLRRGFPNLHMRHSPADRCRSGTGRNQRRSQNSAEDDDGPLHRDFPLSYIVSAAFADTATPAGQTGVSS